MRPSLLERILRGRPLGFPPARVAIFAGSLGLLGGIMTPAPTRRLSLSHATSVALLELGVEASPDTFVWVDRASGVLPWGRCARALVRGKAKGEATGDAEEENDLFLVLARLAPEETLLDLCGVHNLTKSSGVDESVPVFIGGRYFFSTSLGGTITAIHALDLSGTDPASLHEFSQLERKQLSISQWQETGSSRGIRKDSFLIRAADTDTSVEWGEPIRIRIAKARATIDPSTLNVVEGGELLDFHPFEIGKPQALIQWSVDRVRSIPWIGAEKLQWLKAVAMSGQTFAETFLPKKTEAETASDIQNELGSIASLGTAAPPDKELGWPPAPIPPFFKNAMAGEGTWIPLDKDPFVRPHPGRPSPFVTSYVRTDKEKPETRIYVTMWDPRQIALHMEAGTVEPTSASGAAGPGAVPRKREVLKRMVAGFNGGFQAIHGEYGMQAQGVLYLPPKPYAATVMELQDGTTAMGSWPRSADVPSDILSYRQNMTALVEKGKLNPWGRTWWGGTPETWADRIHTTRSGLCRTRENRFGYFWGDKISHEVLGLAMIQAGCDYGMHLDMNPGLAGFEFYRFDDADGITPLGRELQKDWEYEAIYKPLPELFVRSRRMVRGMGHMNFPQYMQRVARDFFYLTERVLLPPDRTPPVMPTSEPGEGEWQSKGLGQGGFPYAFAKTRLQLGPGVWVSVLKVDPKYVDYTRRKPDEALLVFAGTQGAARTSSKGHISLASDRFALGTDTTESIFSGKDVPVAGSWLSTDAEGMLVWLESEGAPVSREDIEKVGPRLGCTAWLALPEGKALLGGTALTPRPVEKKADGIAYFVRREGPSARPYFQDTEFVPWSVWQPLQAKRVRYFPKKKE